MSVTQLVQELQDDNPHIEKIAFSAPNEMTGGTTLKITTCYRSHIHLYHTDYEVCGITPDFELIQGERSYLLHFLLKNVTKPSSQIQFNEGELWNLQRALNRYIRDIKCTNTLEFEDNRQYEQHEESLKTFGALLEKIKKYTKEKGGAK